MLLTKSFISTVRKLNTSATRRPDIGQLFMRDDVRRILEEMTEFDEKVLFSRRAVKALKSPKMIFMTDSQLEKARISAYAGIRAKTQMPPVMTPVPDKTEVISKDEEIAGCSRNKVVFIDIGPGYSRRDRLISVRELDGTLRFPYHDERTRLHYMFFPDNDRSLDTPKLFDPERFDNLLKERKYEFILSRACIQFEPDDPRYSNVTGKVFDYINECSDFNALRSTRFFGPMVMYLIYNKKIDNLVTEMHSRNLTLDLERVEKLYKIFHEECIE